MTYYMTIAILILLAIAIAAIMLPILAMGSVQLLIVNLIITSYYDLICYIKESIYSSNL